MPTSYKALHKRLARSQGPAADHLCYQCGEQAREWAYDGTDPDEVAGPAGDAKGTVAAYSLRLDHYIPLCWSCHRRRDAHLRTHCGKGHALTEANVRIRFSGAGEPFRACRVCAADASRRYRIRIAAVTR